MAFVNENTGAENYSWETEGVYQLEDSDPVQGGADGISNRQARELATRTRNLHTRVKAIVDADFLGTIRGGVSEQYDTLEKLRAYVASLDFSEVNLDELKAELRGDVSAALDTMKEIVDYIDALEFSFNDLNDLPVFQGRAEVTAAVIDWSGKPERFKTLTAATQFSASNLIVGKTIGLLVTGNYATTFTSMFEKVPGSPVPVAGQKNYIQMKCLDDTTGSEKIIYSVMQLAL